MQPENNHRSDEMALASGTRAYQMALYVVFTSGLQMLADTPSRYYENAECAAFIASVPTVWDETRVLFAEPGQYTVMARRSGNRWFIGGINDNTPRDVNVDLSFLNGSHSMTLYTDGINADRKATDYKATRAAVSADKPLTIHMARNGGFAAVIE